MPENLPGSSRLAVQSALPLVGCVFAGRRLQPSSWGHGRALCEGMQFGVLPGLFAFSRSARLPHLTAMFIRRHHCEVVHHSSRLGGTTELAYCNSKYMVNFRRQHRHDVPDI